MWTSSSEAAASTAVLTGAPLGARSGPGATTGREAPAALLGIAALLVVAVAVGCGVVWGRRIRRAPPLTR